jgi:1-acyl-sn-glycerol-3-phosphate acyltransferase
MSTEPGSNGPSATGRSRWRVPALPGGVTPTKRLPITPRDLRRVVRRPSSSFPWAAPTWPDSIAKPPKKPSLGTDYDTEWARRYPARVARLVINEAITRPVIRAITDPKIEGLDRLAHLDGPVIFAANHSSHLDTPLVMSVIPERWRNRLVVVGAADYFFDTKWRAATFALALGAIPIERRRVSRDSATIAARLLEEGWSLLIFPEGGRSPDGWGQTHRGGAGWLAERTGRPVVPIHLEGTRHILARGTSRLRPGTTNVTFGHPLAPTGNARGLAARVESSIAALGDERTTDWWTAKRRAAAGTTPSLQGPDAGGWRRTWALEGRHDQSRQPRAWPR